MRKLRRNTNSRDSLLLREFLNAVMKEGSRNRMKNGEMNTESSIALRNRRSVEAIQIHLKHVSLEAQGWGHEHQIAPNLGDTTSPWKYAQIKKKALCEN